MGLSRLTILFLLVTTISQGQGHGFNLKNVKFNGLEFSTTKNVIAKTFGPGKKIEANYDCGFFSGDQDGGPYYQLVYAGFGYIGSDNERFHLDFVNFDTDGEIKIDYGDGALSGLTIKANFIEMFGETVKEQFEQYQDKDTILLYSKGSDDGAIFTFKDDRLIKFEYWTPC